MKRFDSVGMNKKIYLFGYKQKKQSKVDPRTVFQPPPPSQATINEDVIQFLKERPIDDVGLSDYSEALRELFLEMGIQESFENIKKDTSATSPGDLNEYLVLLNPDGSLNEFGLRLTKLRYDDQLFKPRELKIQIEINKKISHSFVAEGFEKSLFTLVGRGVISRYEALAEVLIYNSKLEEVHEILAEVMESKKKPEVPIYKRRTGKPNSNPPPPRAP